MDHDTLHGRRLTLTAGLMLVAGLIHLLVTPTHLAEARGAGLFFLLLGTAQVLWALVMLRGPTPRLQVAGLVALAIAPTLLFVITRLWRAPFSDGPEGLDTLGAAAVFLQIAVVVLVKASAPGLRRMATRTLATGLAVALVGYAGAVVAEDIHVLAEPEGPHGHGMEGDAEGEAHPETGHDASDPGDSASASPHEDPHT